MGLRDLLRIPGYKVLLRWSKSGTIYRETDPNRHTLTKAQKKRMRRARTHARLLANGRLVERRNRKFQRLIARVWNGGLEFYPDDILR